MRTLNLDGRLLELDEALVMGILNVTDDSFFEASRFQTVESVVEKVSEMLKAGVDVVDIGAASSRPGASQRSSEDEWKDLEPVISEVVKQFPGLLISVDTFHGKVAEKAVAAGAHIVNDISAWSIDPYMLDFISEACCPYILMHMQGRPQSMQTKPKYDDVLREVLQFFIKKLDILRSRGVRDIIIDPGFGFGKSIEDNYEILKKLPVFRILECPILVGLSRKSMIYKVLNITPEESLGATTALHLQALLHGANILRVHDVKEAREVIAIHKMLKADN